MALVVAVIALGTGIPHAQDAETESVFHDHISGPIVQSRCIYCHVEDGQSGHTRLVFVRASNTLDHEALNLQAFAAFLTEVENGHERILTKVQGVAHGGGVQVPVDSTDFAHLDRFLALLEGHPQGFVARLLEGLDEGESSLLFGITTPEDGDSVAGNAVAVAAVGAPSEAVHFAYRPAHDPQEAFAYLGAAANTSTSARLAWNTLNLTDGDYELAALFTPDEGASLTYDAIHVSVDNVDPAETPDIVEDHGRKTQALQTGLSHEVVTADGVVVTLPPGALASDDRITVTVTDPPDPETAPGDAIGVGVAIALASGQSTFREAVTVAVPYPEGKPDGIVHGTDIPEAGLSMWFFNPQTDAWVLLPGSMVQPDADLVVADAAQTGEFGIFNAPLLRLEQDGAAVVGLDFGTGLTVLALTVVNGNAASEPLTWTVVPPGLSWLSVAEAGEVITVSVNRTGLDPGDYAGTLSVTSNGGVREVSVSMRVPTAPGNDGSGGCAALPVLPGGPLDPTLMGLVGLVTVYLMVGRRRLRRQAAMG